MGSRSECEILRATSQLFSSQSSFHENVGSNCIAGQLSNRTNRSVDSLNPQPQTVKTAPWYGPAPIISPAVGGPTSEIRGEEVDSPEISKEKSPFFRENDAHYCASWTWSIRYWYCLQNGRLNRSLISRIERVHDSSTQSTFEQLKREPTNRLKRQRTTSMHSSSFLLSLKVLTPSPKESSMTSCPTQPFIKALNQWMYTYLFLNMCISKYASFELFLVT